MNKCFENYVGVIDSGVGGLTVLEQLRSDFPFCNFVYLADSAYCPYGTKQPSEILVRVKTLVQYLQDNGAQAVVIACNTASVFANKLRHQFPLPIYEVITPTCKRVVDVTQTKRVALLATNATVASNVYQRQLNACNVTVVSFSCSDFVPFVEANEVDAPKCIAAVDRALFSLPKCKVDTVILGCTHFPLLRKKIAPYAYGANIVECCTDFKSCNCRAGEMHGKTLFLTTGMEKQASNAAKWFGQVDFTHVDL